MLTEAKAGLRVKHQVLGDGTIVERVKDPYSCANWDELKICMVEFDVLKEGYSNPFILDWEALTAYPEQ